MKSTLTILIVALCLGACTSKQAGNTQQSTEKSVGIPTGKTKYSIKSGIVHYTTKVMGMDMKYTMYFDEFGAKEATVSVMEMMGMKSQTNTVSKDGYLYSFDPEKKTGTKVMTDIDKGSIDFQNLTEEMKKEMKLEKAGEEVFEGKTCVKYTLDYAKFSMKGTFWVWNGISLKAVFDIGQMKTEMIADKIEENVSVPSSNFEIPADIQFE